MLEDDLNRSGSGFAPDGRSPCKLAASLDFICTLVWKGENTRAKED